MDNLRKDKRYPVEMKLTISELFKQNQKKVTNVDAPIDIFDISKSGLGFTTKAELPLEYYFDASLTVGVQHYTIDCVIKIVRMCVFSEDLFEYGCEFVGMSPLASYLFDDTLMEEI
ncbi:hypothetical protein lbkm_4197 [Lachnospiraceae bacterium KM106-2]|nr:hypothetical protein lbkm_4197 [Lachnospiraceae bacterium KM106-2]